jgi:hypothetical protein
VLLYGLVIVTPARVVGDADDGTVACTPTAAAATTVGQVRAAADVGPAEPGRAPFADASPAQIRAALTAEDAEAFDRHWRALMQRATERLDLTEVHDALEGWRQVAWVTAAHGPEVYGRTLASARERLRSGERAPGALPWAQLKAELGLPE